MRQKMKKFVLKAMKVLTIFLFLNVAAMSLFAEIGFAEILSFEIVSVDNTIEIGTTLEFRAIGTYTDSSQADITSLVSWGSSNTGVATISNSIVDAGLATAHAAGGTTIYAKYGRLFGTKDLKVTDQINDIESLR